MSESSKKEVWSWVKAVLLGLAIAFICREFILAPVKVEGKSMMPTFEDNNRIIVSKMSKVERFDMIVVHSPVSNEDYIKRVIGLPGDIVEVQDDVLHINNIIYDEPYLQENKEMLSTQEQLTDDFKVTVPEGSLYVMGDNRKKSSDSREIGFITEDAIVGEVKFRFFPFTEFGTLE
ncbi:MAG: signal peptidase I [Paenisporosarcina sp.]|nr:signal peptidase I [Paenisporosarcina sp.]